MSTTSIQLALNVDDVSAATAFYEKMFGCRRTACATAMPTSRSRTRQLKLVLIEKPGASELLNHLGIEAASADQVATAVQRLHAAGLETGVAEYDVCCHATQDRSEHLLRLVGS